MNFRQGDMMSPDSNLRYPTWLPRWPPIANSAYIFINIEDREMILVSNSMFWGPRNSTKNILSTSGMSKWVNPRWSPRWPPKSIMAITFAIWQIG